MSTSAKTVHGALDLAAQIDRAGTGLRFLDGQERDTFYAWPVVRDRATAAAGALLRAGVKPGDRVVIVLPTDVVFFDAYFGAMWMGAVPVPLYPPVRLGRMDEYVERTASMVRNVSAVAVVSDARVGRVLGRVIEAARPPLGYLDVSTLNGAPAPITAQDPDALCMVQFSSGTTVDPKPVALTHAQVLANAEVILERIFEGNAVDGDPPAAGVSWLPLYHDMGLIGCVFPALLAPGPLTLIPPERFLLKPALWLRAISRWRGTVSPAPDFAYALCVERITDEEMDGVDLSSWSLALNGAEPIRPATLRAFTERFARWGFNPRAMTPVYGLSEASLAVTFTPTLRGPRVVRLDPDALATGTAVDSHTGTEHVTVGSAFRGFAIELRGPDGAVLPERKTGRLFARGPSVMQGYLGRDVQPIVDGWLDTGDLGVIVDGELVITGRAKDVIIQRGHNHAPHDLERALDVVEGVRTGCAAAVADLTEDGERVLIFVEVREVREGQADACTQAVRAATGLTPDLVVLLEPGTLPRTSSGKIRRAETLHRFREGTLTPPRAVTPTMLAGVLATSWLAHLRARWTRP